MNTQEEIFLVCQECGHVRDTHKMPEDGEIHCSNCGGIEWDEMTYAEIEQKEKIDQRLKGVNIKLSTIEIKMLLAAIDTFECEITEHIYNSESNNGDRNIAKAYQDEIKEYNKLSNKLLKELIKRGEYK